MVDIGDLKKKGKEVVGDVEKKGKEVEGEIIKQKKIAEGEVTKQKKIAEGEAKSKQQRININYLIQLLIAKGSVRYVVLIDSRDGACAFTDFFIAVADVEGKKIWD